MTFKYIWKIVLDTGAAVHGPSDESVFGKQKHSEYAIGEVEMSSENRTFIL